MNPPRGNQTPPPPDPSQAHPSHPDSSPRLVLIGGGGHALVVADAARTQGWSIAGFLDDDADALLASGPAPARRLGAISEPLDLADLTWIIALGHLSVRRLILDRLSRGELGVDDSALVVHPSAIIAPCAALAPGTFVAARAVIQPRATVRAHAIINTGAIIEHECDIGENTHVAPGAVLGGNVRIGHDTLVGLGSRILPGVRIGHGCTIGAGATVVRDVPDSSTVVGVPARPR